MTIHRTPGLIFAGAVCVLAAAAYAQSSSSVLTGSAAFGDWSADKPGVIRKIRPNDIPAPDTAASFGGFPQTAARPVIFVPSTAVRGGAVFVYLNGKAVKKTVRVGGSTQQGLRIEDGLIGGEDLIVNPPAELQDGSKVKRQ